ncbi:MAG: tetratricopeptide repeat protein [Betaproteobacteria bacterium]
MRNHPAITGGLAQAYFALGRYADSYRAFRNASRLDPSDLQPQLGMAAALAMQRKFGEAEALLRRLTGRFPEHPLVWFNLGNALRDQGRAEEAAEVFRRAVSIDPGLADARNNLANALQSLRRLDEAAAELRECIRIAPRFILARCNLASVLIDLGRYAEAEAECLEATKLAPDLGLAHAFLGIARSRQGRLNDALECQRVAVRLAPHDPKVLESCAAVLVDIGAFREGMRWFARALKLNPDAFSVRWKSCFALLRHGCFADGWLAYSERPHPDQIRKYAFDAARSGALENPVNGRRICIVQEQGIGDEIFFLRYAPLLRATGARITCRASQKLHSLIARVPCIEQVLEEDAAPPAADLVMLAGDLPRMLTTDPASPLTGPDAAAVHGDLPLLSERISVFWPQLPPPLPLTPHDDRTAGIRKRLHEFGPPPYLGITWRGGISPGDQRGMPWMLYKEIGVKPLAHALRDFTGTCIALQRNPAPGELDELAGVLGRQVLDLTALNEDLEDMLALLAVIEEYVAVSNTNVHLRAGVGKFTRVLVPCPPDWRWMDAGRTSPWFPACRIYRQSASGDWSTALAGLKGDLELGDLELNEG